MDSSIAQEDPYDLARSGNRNDLRFRAARLLDRAIFYALLALIVLAAVPYGTVEPWWESGFECAVFVLAASWIIEGLLSGSWRAGRHTLLVPLLALVVFAFIQTLP
ncbi:MAG: hypothetical protein LC776_17020, partial [Acidobacteria bacterium]|nr:hypothetical protein [Acidobacteriota bacterium]